MQNRATDDRVETIRAWLNEAQDDLYMYSVFCSGENQNAELADSYLENALANLQGAIERASHRFAKRS